MGQIVGFSDLVTNIHDTAYGIYSSINHVCDNDDFVKAIKMIDNVMDNWTGDNKILEHALKLAELILKQMPYGSQLIPEDEQSKLVEKLNAAFENLDPGNFFLIIIIRK